MRAKRVLQAVIAAGLLAPGAGSAADAQREIAIALAHVKGVIHSREQDIIHMELNEALNCLVGESAHGYDRHEDPCAGLGNGAIQDETDPGKKKLLQAAANTAMVGIEAYDLKPAQQEASKLYAQLRQVL